MASSPDESFTAIDVGSDHTLALMSNGTVWAWGLNTQGQCGINITDDTYFITTPVQVPGISDVKAIASGQFFSMALKNDGTVWTWGNNGHGELGIGVAVTYSEADYHPHPVRVMGLTNVVVIDAGDRFAIVLKDDGTIWTWGSNECGELGNREQVMDYSYTPSPGRVEGPTNVKSIFAGPKNAGALTYDGKLWIWGSASYILGERQFITRSQDNSTPDVLFNTTGITSIAIGDTHGAFLKDDGTVWTWGDDICGQLGNGSTKIHAFDSDFSYVPIEVQGLTNVTSIAAGTYHTLALKDGTVWAWGANHAGQLGDNTTEDRNIPVKVPVSGAVLISAGGLNTMVLDNDGVIKACGDNGYGMLGNGMHGNLLNNCTLQPINFGTVAKTSNTPTPADNESGTTTQNYLFNDLPRLFAIMVIVIILGTLVLFYFKRK